MNYKLTNYVLLTLILLFLISSISKSQDFLSSGRLSGNFQIEAQTYTQDSLIGAADVPDEQILANSWLNLIYDNGPFNVGIRYEAYLNPLLGFDQRFGNNQGVPFRYFTYSSELIDITAGNYYEQFGSGMLFRSYEDRQLGLDNALDGMRIVFKPVYGIELTGLIGKQRNFWSQSDGIIRGVNANVFLNDVFQELGYDYLWSFGGSVVSKYQEDLDSRLVLPENVLAYSVRGNVAGPSFSFETELAYKYNDPNETNAYNYNDGLGIIMAGSYFIEGLSLGVNYHWIDNMDFRSDYQASGFELQMSFIPPLTRQHTYRLPTIYPYATQFNGETGLQTEILYQIPKETFFGGKYGTTIDANYSVVYEIDTTGIDDFTYESSIFSLGDRMYFRDFNIDIRRKLSKNFKLGLTYLNLVYDKDILENQGASKFGKVYSNTIIVDGLYTFDNGHAIKAEFQHMWATQDSTIKIPDNLNGNWVYGLIEYTIAPHYFFTVFNEYNYGNDEPDLRLNYPSVSFAYITGTTRVAFGYGRQRGGILCVGGICREVPASNGFNLNISSSF